MNNIVNHTIEYFAINMRYWFLYSINIFLGRLDLSHWIPKTIDLLCSSANHISRLISWVFAHNTLECVQLRMPIKFMQYTCVAKKKWQWFM